MEHETHAYQLPADLSAPPAVLRWRLRAISIAAVFAVLAVIDLLISHNFDYVLRGWLMGLMICLSFCLGGLALLMVQWVTRRKMGIADSSSAGGDEPHPSAAIPDVFADRDFCQAPVHLGQA